MKQSYITSYIRSPSIASSIGLSVCTLRAALMRKEPFRHSTQDCAIAGGSVTDGTPCTCLEKQTLLSGFL